MLVFTLCFVVILISAVFLCTAGYAGRLRRELDRMTIERDDFKSRHAAISEQLDDCIRAQAESERQLDRYNRSLTLMRVAVRMMLMQSSRSAGDESGYSAAYQELFFLGVPKDVLDDQRKMVEFYQDCVNGEFEVVPGVKPFEHRFLKKSHAAR